MRSRLVVSLFLFTFIATGTLVRAVTNGRPDGNAHPYVGIAIQDVPGMPGFVFVCSGSALSATVFLTAAHCFDPNEPVFVSYGSAPPLGPFTQGTFHPHPDWCPGCGPGLQGFDFHDVAIITLNAAANPGGVVALPQAGLVDALPMGTTVDIVGYGVQGFIRGGGAPAPTHQPGQIFTFTRFFAPSSLVASNNRASAEFIKLSANPSKGTGGLCFGDSGGPDLLGGTNVVLAVNSYVTNGNCSGVTYSNRVDVPEILQFIMSFLI